MTFRWANLDELDRAVFRTAIAFLSGRLRERETFDWALRLKPSDAIKRIALLDLIDGPEGTKIGEPWHSAWRLIEESWNNPGAEEHTSSGAFHAKRRLSAGDRSQSLVTAIVEMVAPRINIEPFSSLHLQSRKPPKRPRTPRDIFSTSLTSGEIVDPGVLHLAEVTDSYFLISLAHALDSAVLTGLNMGRQIGWDGERNLWLLGQLHRVYFVPDAERADGDHEPDEFHKGIAPSVKLLYAVVSRLLDINKKAALEFVRRWKETNSPVHQRLWAALSRDHLVTTATEVGVFLRSQDDRHFWNLHDYPEIAELRATRFRELDLQDQTALATRIRKCPPRNQWPREADAERVESARLYWAVRELRRIEFAGASLPKREKEWLDAKISKFPELGQMGRLDEGYLSMPKARFIAPNPDSRYELLSGQDRLNALESALSVVSRPGNEDPAGRAGDWIRQQGNTAKVLDDLESTSDGGAAFPIVWELFGWAHSPANGQGEDPARRNPSIESVRVLSLLTKLPASTLRVAIDGISHWLSAWEKVVAVQSEALSVWLKLWPIAVELINSKQPVKNDILLNTVGQSIGDREPLDYDTLNTPVGKLVGTFLAACPTVRPGDLSFVEGKSERLMRNEIETAQGAAGTIAKYRLIEQMPYFLFADKSWTLKYLVAPLLADDLEALTLWRAVARQRPSHDIMLVLGSAMADRAVDARLNRDTRRALVFRIVVECLHALHDKREPAVPNTRVLQTIRLLDDEVRAEGAEAIQRFVREGSQPHEGEPPTASPEELFLTAAAPFLHDFWPQERSLATVGVSRALASLPAAAQGAFAEAVGAVERFLLPFNCWSMLDYGLYGEEAGQPKISIIDNQAKAVAFLRLLDLTIGATEGAVIPHDLADALDQIRKIGPSLADDKVFRRLATAARRNS
jgi:hypothetical protein